MPRVRVSIAGLMGMVLVASLGLTALRSDSTTWAGATFLATCGVLAMAVVGVACRDGAERAWWLGFALCGWGYLALAFLFVFDGMNLPTTPLLGVLRPWINGNPLCGFGATRAAAPYPQVGHCLIGLLAASIGGLAALALFGASSREAGGRTDAAKPGEGPRRLGWLLPFAGMGCLLPMAGVARGVTGETWAAGAFFLTWGLLVLAVVGALSNRGQCRTVWLGAALFGIGCMGLIDHRPGDLPGPHVATDRLLHAIRARLPRVVPESPSTGGGEAATDPLILETLERPITMCFPEQTPLDDMLKYIMSQTQDVRNGLPRGIPIYVDPIGLQETEKTLQSPFTLDLEGVPLRISLRLALAQLGLVYRVDEGILTITCPGRDGGAGPVPAAVEPFLVIGR